MEKGKASSLFVNDGSFMEKFKQLEQEKGPALGESKPGQTVSGTSIPKPIVSKTSFESKANDFRKTTPVASSGKLAFSLKQKSKLVAPSVKLSEDEDEEESVAGNALGNEPAKRQKLGQPDASEQSSKQVDVAYNLSHYQHWWKEMFNERFGKCGRLLQDDPTVKKVADKLASFVAKTGRQFEHITRKKNPGDTPFKSFYLMKTVLITNIIITGLVKRKRLCYGPGIPKHHKVVGGISTAALSPTSGPQRSLQQHSNYQTPASALYEAIEDTRASMTSVQTTSAGRSGYDIFFMPWGAGESSAPAGADRIAMMEFYMKKAAQEEKRKQPKQSKDEMPPPASLQAAPSKKGHHMGDYIPQEELEKFLATCNDAAARKAARESAERAKIQSDNVGHKLLSKMGWKEGEGLGSSKSGIADPIMAGNVKLNNLGVGAHQPGEVTPEDDIYEQYKKRMMLGYRYRPNPLTILGNHTTEELSNATSRLLVGLGVP
ncbi:unnamed protein product [Camellia sinensis]